MNIKVFEKIIKTIKKQNEIIHNLHKQKINLLDFVNPYYELIEEILKEEYGDEGLEWWLWFCFENNYGKKGLEAFDENKKPICYSIKSIHKYLEKNYKKIITDDTYKHDKKKNKIS